MQNHQIDLHYHAGGEREKEKPLRTYLAFASQTGRRILGITDHSEAYLPEQPEKVGLYPRSAQGLAMLRGEIDAIREEFPHMQLFFGPEMGFQFHALEDSVVEISDYFICEPVPFRGDKTENTELLEQALEKAAHVRRQTGKPVFLAHPFRSQMYHRYDTDCFGPVNSGPPEQISEEEAGDFLGTDLAAFAKASIRLAVPIEINGVTLFNAQSLNWPYFAKVLHGAYLALHRRGASFVPGSDQHNISVGRGAAPLPASVFNLLGLKTAALPFLCEIGAKIN